MRNTRKIVLLCLTVVLALGAMGVGYATWSQTLTITEEVNTGNFCMEFGRQPVTVLDPFCPPPLFPLPLPDPPTTPEYGDWNATTDFASVYITDPRKNVACGEAAYDVGANPQGLTIILHDVYPWYYNHFDFWVHNCGTIPAHLNKILVKDAPGPGGNLLAEITSDGQIVTLDLDGNGTDDFQFKWGDHIGDQFDPCNDLNISFGVLILQDDGDTIQGGKFTFYIELVFDQFNAP